jgi:4-diphosphocytidyl-2-C-methyl-D-erythritol kinase
MTGSGACVFCAFHSEEQADAVLEDLIRQAPATWKGWKAKALGKHPLAL